MCFPHILHGSISRFDVLLHGQLASHNAQSATELRVKGHTHTCLEENELDARGGRKETKKRGGKKTQGMEMKYFKAHFIVMDQKISGTSIIIINSAPRRQM